MPIIITDSTCDLSYEEANNLGVDEMISLKVSFGDEEYLDKKTITNDMFYEKLKICDDLPRTALISVGEFSEIFNKYPNDDLVVLLLSSKLSGTYQSALIAKEMSNRENIYLVDSKTVTLGLSLIVTVACKLRNEGKSAEEIAKKVEQLADKVRIYAVIDTLKYLVKGGRLPKVAGIVAETLGFKPLIKVTDGEVVNIGKARGIPAALDLIVKTISNNEDINYDLPTCFAHTGNLTSLENLKSRYPNCENIRISTIGSVVGTHVGPGAVAIAFFDKN